jgi:hypothetical protein
VPGQIYDHSVFPLSMTSFFLVLTLVCLRRQRWVAAGLAGAVVTATYPTGVVLVPALAIWLLALDRREPIGERLGRALTVGGLASLGFGFVLLYDRLATGAFDAYFKVQAHYHHVLRDPLAAWLDAVKPLVQGHTGRAAVPAMEAAAVGLLIVVLLVHAALKRRRLTDIEGLVLLLAVLVWLFPLSLGTTDPYRSDALLLPAGLLVRRLPASLSLSVVAVAALLSMPMAAAFFDRVLG